MMSKISNEELEDNSHSEGIVYTDPNSPKEKVTTSEEQEVELKSPKIMGLRSPKSLIPWKSSAAYRSRKLRKVLPTIYDPKQRAVHDILEYILKDIKVFVVPPKVRKRHNSVVDAAPSEEIEQLSLVADQLTHLTVHAGGKLISTGFDTCRVEMIDSLVDVHSYENKNDPPNVDGP
ncbi:hypothetical protein Zmor_004264 [Zophobas morio]|uniref:Uncharacterized protein n=1 Tax=Zophobas morio TaxID=2755281 RepID=A0AA38HJE5_9CUCU|nr:hypothetical protein Zmor_004264 [Zophobas morio]